MAVTPIPAWMVACGGTCKAPHGYHLVTKLNGRFGCNCPAFEYHAGPSGCACKHIDEVIGVSRVPTPIRRISDAARERAESQDYS